MEFRLARIPVRVDVSFLVVSILLGLQGGDIASALIWLVLVFLSVLVHELGHAFAGRAFGLTPRIDLHGMGGTTSFQAGATLNTWRSIVLSLAGPFAGFALGGTLILLKQYTSLFELHPLLPALYRSLLWINLGWGLVNLIPVLPLDGGLVAYALLRRWLGPRAQRVALLLSLVVASIVIVAGFWFQIVGVAILMLMVLMRNVAGLRALAAVEKSRETRVEQPPVVEFPPSDEALQATYERGDAITLLTLAKRRMSFARDAAERSASAPWLVRAYLLTNDAHRARVVFETMISDPSQHADLERQVRAAQNGE